MQAYNNKVARSFGIFFFWGFFLFCFSQKNENLSFDDDLHLQDSLLVAELESPVHLEIFDKKRDPRFDGDDQIIFEKPYVFVSLGTNCGPALLFRARKKTQAFFPFDWCITPFDALYRALETDFKDFLNRENLSVFDYPPEAHHRYVEDALYGIKYLHDFTLEGEPLNDYDQIKELYRRRTERFYRVMSIQKKIYFFRTACTKEEALVLKKLINQKFPGLDYVLIVVNEIKEFKKNWKIKRIKNYYLKGCAVPILNESKGVREGWNAIFADLMKEWPEEQKKSLTPLQKKRRKNQALNLLRCSK